MEKRGVVHNAADDDNLNRGDSFRKVLPTKPSTSLDSRLTMSGRVIERPSAVSERGAKYYAPFIQEYCLWAEFLLFQKKEIPGLYVNTADKTPFLWYGVMFVHTGFYEGGIFRFKIHFSSTYPEGDCPRLAFDNKIFHPAVSEDNGDLNVAAEFRTWRKGHNHVWQILQYAKDAFENVTTNAPLNTEAAQLFENDPDAFEAKAKQCAAECKAAIFQSDSDDDINFLRFEPFNPNAHGEILSQWEVISLQDS